MSGCPDCWRFQGAVNFAYNDLGALRGQLIRHSHDSDVAGLVVKVQHAKAELATALDLLKAHQAECEVAQTREPRRLHVPASYIPRAAKPKRKRGRPSERVVDPAAVAAALSEPPPVSSNNRLPATGRCHTCDRRVSGERRYCGRCLASRA